MIDWFRFEMDGPISLAEDKFYVTVSEQAILSLWFERPSRALCAFFYLGNAKIDKDDNIGFLRHPTIATTNAAANEKRALDSTTTAPSLCPNSCRWTAQ